MDAEAIAQKLESGGMVPTRRLGQVAIQVDELESSVIRLVRSFIQGVKKQKS